MDDITLRLPEVNRQPCALVVEDSPEILMLVSSMLHVRRLQVLQTSGVAEARRIIAERHPDLLFLDVTLPDGSGLSLVDKTGPDDPLVVVMTGALDLETAVEALRKGAVDFIAKPFTVGDFLARVDRVVGEWRTRERLRAYNRSLEELVRSTADELARSERRVDDAYDMAVAALGAALDLKDYEPVDHCRRVSANTVRLGREVGLSEGELHELGWSAYLHDIGKIGVPERIIALRDELAGEDRRIMEQHPAMGCRILRAVDFLAHATDVVQCHHERFDGTGYPAHLAGTAIPLAARIFAIADALDAATADRPEHRARPFAEFAAELARDGGRRFDPDLVAIFLGMESDGWQLQGAPALVVERS
jgi:putative two-component system response regulator